MVRSVLDFVPSWNEKMQGCELSICAAYDLSHISVNDMGGVMRDISLSVISLAALLCLYFTT